jgi:hypothetical protein
MKKLLASCGLFVLVSCGRAVPEQTSTQHLDIDVPKDIVDPNDIKELAVALNEFVVEGKSQVDFKVLASQINVTGDFKEIFDQVVNSRDALVDVECQGRKCVAKSTGTDFSFKPPVSLPVVGKPTVILSKDITFYGELSADLQRLEVCRIDGIKIKVSLFTQNVEGALIELLSTPGKTPEQDQSESVTTVKTLKVDAGAGGSYPSRSCQF